MPATPGRRRRRQGRGWRQLRGARVRVQVQFKNVKDAWTWTEELWNDFTDSENLSISYTEAETTYDAQAHVAAGATDIADVDLKSDAIQVAYSMGAMSIKAYRMDSENPGWDDDAADMTETEIALGLAF